MQATFSAPKNVIDLLPRKQPVAPRSDSTNLDSRLDSRSPFATRLADARADRAKDDAETKPTAAAQDTAGTSKSKPASDAKPVDKADSRDDAASQSEEAKTSPKKPTAKKPDDADAADDDGEDAAAEATDAKPKAAAKPVAVSVDAAFLSAQSAGPTKAEAAKKDAKSDTKTPDAAAVAAAVATTATVASDATTTDTSVDADAAAATSPVDFSLTKGANVEADAKPKVKVDGKAAEAEAASVDADAVPAAHGTAPHKQHADAESGKQQDAALAATDSPKDADKADTKKSDDSTFDALLAKLTPADTDAAKPVTAPTPAVTPQPLVAPERQFAEDNIDNVVKNVHTQIATGGNGQMRIRLDPPELGALEVSIKMTDGRMSAAFTTSNDDATQLLSHNLSNLKTSLEASGINVDRIQVRQSSADNNAQQQPGSGEHRRDGASAFDQSSQRGDQQRKDAVQKMWRKLAYGSDELDFVA